MKKLFLIILMLSLQATLVFANVSISGKITNKEGKPLTGIEVYLTSTQNTNTYNVLSDKFGNYSCDVEKGKYNINLKIYDYEYSKTWKIKIKKNVKKDFSINSDKFKLYKNVNRADEKKSRFRLFGGDSKSESSPMAVGAMGLSEAPSESKRKLAKPTARAEAETISDDIAMSAEFADFAEIDRASSVSPGAGTLTSGELNDFRKWDMWNDLNEDEFKSFSEKWKFNPNQRYTAQLVNKTGSPVVDASVALKDKKGNILWEAKTDNTGKAELWYNLHSDGIDEDDLVLDVQEKFNVSQNVKVTPFQDGINIINSAWQCDSYSDVDILFAVDATGSMGDEIEYLQSELNDIITRTQKSNQNLNINLGSLFYRDGGDEYLLKKSPFSTDIEQTIDFINEQNAGGGGDFPEAVDIALQSAVNDFQWSENAVARLLFLILDAPAHSDEASLNRIHQITARLAMEGIRVIPVACSGIQRETEFLMRSIALATNGTYVFLTDDSGVGGDHLGPMTDSWEVEKMNDLFIRLINQFTMVPECKEADLTEVEVSDRIFNKGDVVQPPKTDISDMVKHYPNPTSGEFTLEISTKIDELYIVDIAGKIIKRVTNLNTGRHTINISDFPSGIYFIKFLNEEGWGFSKVVVQK